MNSLTRRIAFVLLASFFCVLACTAEQRKEIGSAISAGSTVACDVANDQPEPAWVNLLCTLTDEGGKVLQTFAARAPRPKLAAASCPRVDGSPAP